MKEWKDCVVYDFCSNEIKIVYMEVDKVFGDYYVTYCGYTGKEYHQIFLGKLNN